LVHHPTFSFSVHVFQCAVDFLHLGRKCREFATYIGSDLFLAMDTFVFLDVLGHFFGDHIMVAKKVAEERREFVAILGRGSLHSRCCLESMCDLGNRKNAVIS